MAEKKKSFSNGVWLCEHCGDQSGTAIKLCANCRTAEQRAKMDAENKAIFEAAGKVFRCSYCLRKKAGLL